MANAREIDQCLPQTQCGQCGFDGCMPYAQALAEGRSTIDRCPPGGTAVLNALGALLTIDPTPYQSTLTTRSPSTAVIREAECIGCTKCIQACPVDAIVGSAKTMHSVLTHECTGCGLCVEPCPVDCIEMQPLKLHIFDKTTARERFSAKKTRQIRDEHQRAQAYREKRKLSANQLDTAAKQSYILNAVARKAYKKHD